MKSDNKYHVARVVFWVVVLAFATWLGVDPPWAESEKVGDRAFIEEVEDGDTIKARLLDSGKLVTVRIQGIDCPESHRNKKCERSGEEGRDICSIGERGRHMPKKCRSAIMGHGCEWQIPRGLEASRRAAHWLKNKTVLLECDEECTIGKYGRALRYVRIPETQAERNLDPEKMAKGIDFGLQMIKEGYCEDYGWKYHHPRAYVYERAQQEAKRMKIGIWGEDIGGIPQATKDEQILKNYRLDSQAKLKPGKLLTLGGASKSKPFKTVFEDDGETGYFYALEVEREDNPIVDAMHIYNVKDIKGIYKALIVKIVWSKDEQKSALLLNDYPHAVFDFEKKRGYCRTGGPPPNGKWTKQSHKWDDDALKLFE